MKTITLRTKWIDGKRYVRLRDIVKLVAYIFRLYPSRVSVFIYHLFKGVRHE
jgi:hypothetical protein